MEANFSHRSTLSKALEKSMKHVAIKGLSEYFCDCVYNENSISCSFESKLRLIQFTIGWECFTRYRGVDKFIRVGGLGWKVRSAKRTQFLFSMLSFCGNDNPTVFKHIFTLCTLAVIGH